MPYASAQSLPAQIRDALPAHALEIFRAAANSSLDKDPKDDTKAMQIAWAAVKNAGYEKNAKGEWVLKKGEPGLSDVHSPAPLKTKKEIAFGVNITKMDDERNVFGWLSVVETADGQVVKDMQGHTIAPEVLEKAAYGFVLDYRNAGERHRKIEGVGKLIESVMLTKEKQEAMGLSPGSVPVGWWVGFHVDDPAVWAKVKAGEYKMFSIGGDGILERAA